MKQFNLSEWLQDKSRKVVTRRGNSVRIICIDRKHGKDELPIVFLEENNGGEFLLTCRNDGRCNNYDTPYDLFFADEEEELTELQKTLEEDCDYYVKLYNDGNTREELREWIKCWCHRIIDLARKEIEKENSEKLKESEKYQLEIDRIKLLSPQSKQEWSEDDEETLNIIANHIRNDGRYSSPILANEYADFVLSIPRNRWKPSEEQMKAVFYASERNDVLGSVLRNLYDDLKKL